MTSIKYFDATNNVVQLSATVDNVGNLVPATCFTDPGTGNKAAVQQFHNMDNQIIGSQYGLYTGGVDVVFNGTSYDRFRSAPGNLGSLLVSSDGAKVALRSANVSLTPAATPTDVMFLQGAVTKTLRLKKIILSGTATTAGQFVWFLIRRTGLDTGGTIGGGSVQRLFDLIDPGPQGSLTFYTANPTSLATSLGVLRASRLFHNLSSAQPDRVVWDYCSNQDQALILRGGSDIVAINGNGAALPAGATLDIDIEWEEDNS